MNQMTRGGIFSSLRWSKWPLLGWISLNSSFISHASGKVLGIAMSGGPSEISQQLIDGLPLNADPLVPPAGQTFHLSNKISQKSTRWIHTTCGTDDRLLTYFMFWTFGHSWFPEDVSQWLVIPWHFLYSHHNICSFEWMDCDEIWFKVTIPDFSAPAAGQCFHLSSEHLHNGFIPHLVQTFRSRILSWLFISCHHQNFLFVQRWFMTQYILMTCWSASAVHCVMF